MSGLFNSFNFGITFDANENTGQHYATALTPGVEDGSTESDVIFVSMFGDTSAAGGYIQDYGDALERSMSFYGADGDADGLYGLAQVYDDHTNALLDLDAGKVVLDRDVYRANQSHSLIGVALVRDVTSVSEPGTISLLSMGLVGMMLAKRRRKRLA